VQFAYLDPGSGSVIATAIVGGAAAAGVVLRSARAKVGGMFSRNKGSAEPGTEATEDALDGSESSSPADVDS
jgi:hypothetical protein